MYYLAVLSVINNLMNINGASIYMAKKIVIFDVELLNGYIIAGQN